MRKRKHCGYESSMTTATSSQQESGDDRRDSQHTYGDRAARKAAEVSTRTRRLHAEVQAVPMPLRGMGTVLVLAVGAWLLIGEFVLAVPYTSTGRQTAVRDEAFAIVVLLVGMVLRTAWNRRAAALLVLLGLLLVASGIWEPHDAGREAVNEVVSGALLICGALAAAVRRGDDTSRAA